MQLLLSLVSRFPALPLYITDTHLSHLRTQHQPPWNFCLLSRLLTLLQPNHQQTRAHNNNNKSTATYRPKAPLSPFRTLLFNIKHPPTHSLWNRYLLPCHLALVFTLDRHQLSSWPTQTARRLRRKIHSIFRIVCLVQRTKLISVVNLLSQTLLSQLNPIFWHYNLFMFCSSVAQNCIWTCMIQQ